MSHRFRLGISFPPGGGGNFLASMLLIQEGVKLWGRKDEDNNEWYVNPAYCYRGGRTPLTRNHFLWANHNEKPDQWHLENDFTTEKVYIIKNTKICSSIHLLKRYWNPNLVENTGQLIIEQAWRQPHDPNLLDSRKATLKKWNRLQNSYLRNEIRRNEHGREMLIMSYMFYSWLLVNPWHNTWQQAWDNYVPWAMDQLYSDSGSFGDMSITNTVSPQQMFSVENSVRMKNAMLDQGVADEVERIDFDEFYILKTQNIPGVPYGVRDRWMKHNDSLMLDLLNSIHDNQVKQEQFEITQARYANWRGISQDK